VTPVDVELLVEVTHMRVDGVDRQVQFAGDLLNREAGGQEAQYPHLGLTQRLAEDPRLGRLGAAFRADLARVVDQPQDAGDDDGVFGRLLGVPCHELGRRVKYERVQHPIGLGESQGAVQRAAGGGLVPGRIAGDGLEQQHLHHPGRVIERDGAGDDGGEREDCRLGIVLMQPQRRDDGPHRRGVELVLAQVGQGLPDRTGLAREDAGVEVVRAHPGHADVRGAEQSGEALGGLEFIQRPVRMAARELERGPDPVEAHAGRWLELGGEDLLGAIEPASRLGQVSLIELGPAELRVGHADHRMVAPAVPGGHLDDLPAALRAPLDRLAVDDAGTVREPEKFQIGPAELPRQPHPLVKVVFRLHVAEGPRLGHAQADQR
jgi:hypothetical protein